MAIGRPKLAPQDQLSELVSVRCMPAQRAEYQQKADMANVSVAEFLRAAGDGYQFTIIQSNAPDPETKEQLRRIGVNINQMTKRMNEQKTVPPSELITTMETLQTLLARWMFDDPQNHHRPQL